MPSHSSESSFLEEKEANMATYQLHNDMSRFDIPMKRDNHPETCFQEELKGWHGYVEWEKYPEKRMIAQELLAKYSFEEVCVTTVVIFTVQQ